MSTVVSRACLFGVVMAVALGGCGGDEPSSSTPPPGTPPPRGGAGALAVNLQPLTDEALDRLTEKLVTVTVPTPPLPADAVKQTIGAEGAEVELGPVRVRVPKDGAAGELEVALIPRRLEAGRWEGLADRIRPLGEPFSLVARGSGVLSGGRVEVAYDRAAVPEGWEARLARVPAAGSMLGSTALAQQADGNGRGRPAAQRPPTFTLGDLADIDDADRLADDLTDLLGSRDDYLQVVLVKGVETIRVNDEQGRHWLTVHLVEPPVHGKRDLVRRLINALDNSRTKAEQLEFRRPNGVISVTVLGEVRIDEKAVPAAVWGNDIAISSSLHVYGPFDGAGLLERVAAEMYARVLWSNAVSAETLALRKPASNRWVIDGSSEWFVRQVYPAIADKTDPRRAVAPLFTLGPEAYPFWQFLEKKTGTWSFAAHLMDIEYQRRLRAAGLPMGKLRDLMKSKVFEAQAVGTEAVLLPQAMAMRVGWGADVYDPGRSEPELIVRRAVTAFGYVYSMFAAEYLRPFLPQEPAATAPTEDNPLGDRLAAEQRARDYPLTAPWVQVSLTNVDGTAPLERHLVLDDFSAVIVRYIQPVQRGEQSVSIQDVKFRDEPTDRAPFAYAFASQKYPVIRVRGGGDGVGDIEDLGAAWPAGDSLALLVNPNMSWWQPDTADPSGSKLVLDSAFRSGPIRATLTAHMAFIYPPKTPDDRERRPFDRPMSSGSTKHCVGNIPGRSCFATIQQAINAPEVEPGDIILVGPGEYNEAVEVNKEDLTIVGTQPGAVVVRAESNIVFNIEAPGTRIGNLLILRQGGYGPANADWAVAIRGQDVWLINNVIAGAPGTGIHMSGVNHRIINNWLNVSNHGVYASSSPGVQIQDNVILPMLVRAGIAGWQLTDLGVEVPGEELDQGNVGITVYGGDGAVVSGNYVGPDPEHPAPGWFGALYLTQMQWPRVLDNDLHTYGLQQSVFLRTISHAQFRDNRVSGGGTAIDIAGDSLEDLTFERNVVDAGWSAISITDARGVYFHDNTLLSKTQALTLESVTNFSAFQDRYDGWSHRWFGSPWSGGVAVSLSKCSDARFHNVTAIGINSTISIDKCKGVRLRNSTVHQLRYDGRVESPSVAAVLQDVDSAQINNLTVRSAFGGVTIIRGSSHTIRGLDLVDPRLESGLHVDGVNVAARRVEFPNNSFVPVFGKNVTVGLDHVTFNEPERAQPAVVMDRLEYRGFPAGTDGSNELPRLTHRPATLRRPDRQGVTLYLPYEWETEGVATLNFDRERTRSWIRPRAGDRLNIWDPMFSVFRPPDEAAGGPIRIVLERAE